MYKLPEFRTILNGRYKKKEWKIIIKRSIRQYWTDQLQNELPGKTTLSLLCHDCLEVGKTHNIWDTVENSVIEVRKTTMKARMLTGTYILQVHKNKFNQAEIDTICPLCRTEDENLLYILTRYPAYTEERKIYYSPIKETVFGRIGVNAWQTHFNNIETIGKLIIDCQSLALCTDILPKGHYIPRRTGKNNKRILLCCSREKNIHDGMHLSCS